jgi:pimeloyl-ACP methyl ester carboxylesterase
VEDVRKFLDQLKVRRVTLAGHSIAGDELTAFAVKYPDRVDRLVYLDAAFRRGAMRDVFTKAPPQLQPGPDDVKSYGSFRTLLTRLSFWSESWDANLREMMVLDERGVIVRQAMPPAVSRLMMRGTMEFVPEYEKVAAPALSIAAVGWSPALERHVRSLPPAERGQAQAFRDDVLVPCQRAEIDRFRKGMRNGRVVELPDTDHHCFIQRRDQVASEMRAFLSGN